MHDNRVRMYRKARLVNSTHADFPDLTPTKTRPLGTGATATARSIIDLSNGNEGSTVPKGATIIGIGTDADNEAFAARLYGWSRLRIDGEDFYIPTIICELTVTLGAETGESGGLLTTTDFFADTLAIVTEATLTADVTRSGTVEVTNTTDLVARAEVCWKQPFEILEATFNLDSAASANLLIGLH